MHNKELIEIRFYTGKDDCQVQYFEKNQSLLDFMTIQYSFVKDENDLNEVLKLYFDSLTFCRDQLHNNKLDYNLKLIENTDVYIKIDINKYLIFSEFLESLTI